MDNIEVPPIDGGSPEKDVLVMAMSNTVTQMNVGEYVESTDPYISNGISTFWASAKSNFSNIDLKIENNGGDISRFTKRAVADAAPADASVNTDSESDVSATTSAE